MTPRRDTRRSTALAIAAGIVLAAALYLGLVAWLATATAGTP